MCGIGFNVDKAAKGKPKPAGIGGVLWDSESFFVGNVFQVYWAMMSNEVEVLAILEAVQIFASSSFHSRFEVESDSLNPISWVPSSVVIFWRFCFTLI